MKVRIAGTIKRSFVNGTGTRFVVFFQGCAHHCKGCQNPDTWDFEGGEETTTEELLKGISRTKYIDGITISGGDPFFQLLAMMELARGAKELGLSVWVYTGFTYEQIPKQYLKNVDVLVDGLYLERLKCSNKMYGSINQRIIHLKDGEIVENKD